MSRSQLFLERAKRYFERAQQEQLDKTNSPPPYSEPGNPVRFLSPNDDPTASSQPTGPPGQATPPSAAQIRLPDALEWEISALRHELELQRTEGMCVACGKELEEGPTVGSAGFSASTLGHTGGTESGYRNTIEWQTETILNGWRTIISMDRLVERKSVKLKSLATRLVVVEAELGRMKRHEEAELARRKKLEETTYLSIIQSWATAPVDWVFEELERFLSL